MGGLGVKNLLDQELQVEDLNTSSEQGQPEDNLLMIESNKTLNETITFSLKQKQFK